VREGGEFSIGGDGEARAIEDEAVVAADLIDVNDGDFVMSRRGSKHVDAQAALIKIIGRRRNIEENCSSLPDKLGDGIAFIEALNPEFLVVPAIFANGDAELLALKQEIRLRTRGLKITRFVEDVVGGEKQFALFELNFTIGEKRGAIRGRLAGIVLGFADVTDDGRHGHFFGEAGEFFLIALEEFGTLDEILRRIAAEAKFGENDKAGAARFCRRGHFQHARGIAGEIADGGIELGEGYFHRTESAYRKAVASG